MISFGAGIEGRKDIEHYRDDIDEPRPGPLTATVKVNTSSKVSLNYHIIRDTRAFFTLLYPMMKALPLMITLRGDGFYGRAYFAIILRDFVIALRQHDSRSLSIHTISPMTLRLRP